jgi:hypothetical protein
MRNNTEVITMKDKDQRDRLFRDLRRHGNEQEQKVCKFSDVEETTKLGDKKRSFVSTWSVAYPKL